MSIPAQQLKLMADAVRQIRPEWSEAGVLNALVKLAGDGGSFTTIMALALSRAGDPESHTPAALGHETRGLPTTPPTGDDKRLQPGTRIRKDDPSTDLRDPLTGRTDPGLQREYLARVMHLEPDLFWRPADPDRIGEIREASSWPRHLEPYQPIARTPVGAQRIADAQRAQAKLRAEYQARLVDPADVDDEPVEVF